MNAAEPVFKPLGLLAELTHRCPLGCPYCSNPLALDRDELDTATWSRVFREAAGLGVLQVHLSGGEPAARRDLAEITAAAHQAGLYTNLITSAVGLTPKRFAALADAGLDHVQISIQDHQPNSADHIAGYAGAYERKRMLAAEVVRRRLGPALAQRDAGRQGAALPCGGEHSGPGVLVGARAFAGGDLGKLAGLPRLPGHRLDARAVRELPAPV